MENAMSKVGPYLSVVLFVGGVVGAHFHGLKSTLDESKRYVDHRIDKIESKIDQALGNQAITLNNHEIIKDELSEIKTIVKRKK